MNNPPPVLILEFRRRKVSVARSQWLSYDVGTPAVHLVLSTTLTSSFARAPVLRVP